MHDELPCDISGQCTPMNDNFRSQVTNCAHCGKELVWVDGQWKTWDWDL